MTNEQIEALCYIVGALVLLFTTVRFGVPKLIDSLTEEGWQDESGYHKGKQEDK